MIPQAQWVRCNPMQNKKTDFLLLGFIAVCAIAGAVAYPSLPERFDSHWNAAGQADGSMPKFWGVAIFPLIMFGLYLLYLVIPRIDPLRVNIESFRATYDYLWIGIFLFLGFVFALSLVWNLGYHFNFTRAIVPAIAALWFLLGMALGKLKRNWFVGIRTPWTLSSDIVWEKTHALGGKLFKVAAIVSLGGIFVSSTQGVLFFLVAPILLVTVIVVAYSYVVHRSLQ